MDKTYAVEYHKGKLVILYLVKADSPTKARNKVLNRIQYPPTILQTTSITEINALVLIDISLTDNSNVKVLF